MPSAKVSSIEEFENVDSDDKRDIWSYITEDQWPIMVAIFVNDDVEKLRRFAESTRVDWKGFLQCSDIRGLKRSCPPHFRSYSNEIRVSRNLVKHPYPSNPFLMAVMYNAKLCCCMIRETAPALDLSSVLDTGFNAYHTLFAGLDIIRVESPTREKRHNLSFEYLRHFIRDFFSSAEVAYMAAVRNCFHMQPLEWGVYCGYADWVDELLYRSFTEVVQCEISGQMEHVELDFSVVVSTDPSRFVSILSIMAEVFGERRVADLGVFRRPLVLAPLVDAFYARHRFIVGILGLFTTMSTAMLVAGCDSDYRAHVTTACSPDRVSQLPAFFLTTRCVSLAFWALLLSVAMVGRQRKNRHRRIVGFPPMPRQTDRDSIAWMLPALVSLAIDGLLIILVCAPISSCYALGGGSYRPLVGTLILAQLISFMCSLTTAGRLLPLVSKFINSFYRSFAMFAHFLVIYLILLVVFSRLLKVAYRTAPAAVNGTASASTSLQQPENDDFLPAAYRAFLITLNVFDTEAFRPGMDRADLMFTHMAFILLTPTMFINFVVGVLSSVVSETMAYDVESRYLLRLSFSEFCESTFFWLYRVPELVTGKRRRLVLSICRPLTRMSRSVQHLNDREL